MDKKKITNQRNLEHKKRNLKFISLLYGAALGLCLQRGMDFIEGCITYDPLVFVK